MRTAETRCHKALAQPKEGIEGTVVVCLWGPAASVFDPTRAGVREDATATRGACATLPYEAMHSIEVINRVGSRCGLSLLKKKAWRTFARKRKRSPISPSPRRPARSITRTNGRPSDTRFVASVYEHVTKRAYTRVYRARVRQVVVGLGQRFKPLGQPNRAPT